MADAGEIVFAPGVPDHPHVRAEGIRALSRYMAFGLEQCLERADLARPEFVDVQTTIRTYFTDLSLRQGHPRPTIEALPASGPTPMLTPSSCSWGWRLSCSSPLG